MCYSAMVRQSVKKMGLKYEARVQLDAFEEVFENRLKGSGAKIPRAMELSFQTPENPQEKRIWKLIEAWEEMQTLETEQELFVLKKRLADAERKLKVKETKTALNELRIAGDKIEKMKAKLKSLGSESQTEFARIFPQIYSPLITFENGERTIRPFRYLLRPRGQGSDFDRDFNGSYNARRDRLQEVFWWKSVYGRNHGVMVVSKFWENVKVEDYEQRMLKQSEQSRNLVLEFKPKGLSEMLVPCIFDSNTSDEFAFHSFALITDEPNPEVKAAGHDRTPVIMKDAYLDLWLQTSKRKLEEFELVFKDKQPTYFEHSIAV
ncbi:MAG: SOS response-associated peptidase family protein [Bdellovibrionales bacterium]|nr:SOS response-associated peptidase family protein [Oligoflexia bacterium]